MIGSFSTTWDRIARMAGAPAPEKRIRSWAEEIAMAVAEQPKITEDCAHMQACAGAVVSASRLRVNQSGHGPAILSGRPSGAKTWRCPMPADDCQEYEPLIQAAALVRDRG
jgi:hypothetical protein